MPFGEGPAQGRRQKQKLSKAPRSATEERVLEKTVRHRLQKQTPKRRDFNSSRRYQKTGKAPSQRPREKDTKNKDTKSSNQGVSPSPMGPADGGTTGGAAAAAAADGGTDGSSAAGAAAASGGAWWTPLPLPLAPSAAAEGSFRLSRGTYVPALFVTTSLSFCTRG